MDLSLTRFLARENSTRSCDPPPAAAPPTPPVSRYEDGHKTDMLAIRGGERGGHLLCLDCALTTFFGGSLAALEDIDYGRASRGMDREGYPYQVVHHANVERDLSFIAQGRLVCSRQACGREIYAHEPF